MAQAGAATSRPGPRLGVLPFVDGTGGSARAAGISAAQTLIDEVAKATELVGVAVNDLAERKPVDDAAALDAARRHGLDYVFVGTVLEATSRESSRGGWLPKIKSSSIHVTIRSIEAKTSIQGVLLDVSSGQRLLTTTVKRGHRDNAYAGRVWSAWGSWDVGDHAAFLASPMGQAFVEASREMTKNIAEVTAQHAATTR
ncbi:MAG: hypothetical protein IT361_06815 [Gemmatimonadaceae bacterium]|nr:hypothetical protein [Gemmatimonadaceae bacterium]